ncbi:MAG: transcriptional repressor [bacterium]|nr:transcriptional repressor [bacterium]
MNKKVLSILKEKKVKATAVRELVLDVFLKHPHALSLSAIEEILPWRDRVTIFRTLKTFEQKGVIHKIKDGSDSVKYALCYENCESYAHFDIHPHFHCEKCGKTICLNKQKINIDDIPDDIIINNYSLILNGLCIDCK